MKQRFLKSILQLALIALLCAGLLLTAVALLLLFAPQYLLSVAWYGAIAACLVIAGYFIFSLTGMVLSARKAKNNS